MHYILIALFLIAACVSVITLVIKTNNVVANRIPNQEKRIIPNVKTAVDDILDELKKAHPDQTAMLLLEDNLEAFAVRVVSARTAKRTLDLQYYIWHNDLTGNLLNYEILQAADRGVQVRLLLDDLNARDKDALFAILDTHPNIEIRLFNPIYNRKSQITRSIEMLFRSFSINRRMHNKAWIVDDNIAIIGGRNIGNEYFDADFNTNFFDVDIMVAGTATDDAISIFNTFWHSDATVALKQIVKPSEYTLEQLREKVRNIDEGMLKHAKLYLHEIQQTPNINELLAGEREIFWSDNAHILSDPPEKAFDEGRATWLFNNIFSVFEKAQKNIYLVSPYFIPGDEGIKGFAKLREKEIDINILTNSLAATDVLMVHGGYTPYRKPLLELGISLYEVIPFNKIKKSALGSKGASLHTKMFIIDNAISFIGSFNFDPRSAMLNTEMGIFFEQPEITAELLAIYSNKINKNNSYHVFLDDKGNVNWEDGSDNQLTIWRHEPETHFFMRGVAKVISWLPIESQL